MRMSDYAASTKKTGIFPPLSGPDRDRRAAAGGAGAGGLGAGEIAAAFLVLGILSGLAAGFDGNRICASLVAGCRKMGPGALTIALAAALRLVPCR